MSLHRLQNQPNYITSETTFHKSWVLGVGHVSYRTSFANHSQLMSKQNNLLLASHKLYARESVQHGFFVSVPRTDTKKALTCNQIAIGNIIWSRNPRIRIALTMGYSVIGIFTQYILNILLAKLLQLVQWWHNICLVHRIVYI